MPIDGDYIKAEGRAGRMSTRLMAIVAEGDRERIYLSPMPEHEEKPRQAEPSWVPEAPIGPDRRSMFTPLYGLTHFKHLFTGRQLVALETLTGLVSEARDHARRDAMAAAMPDDGVPIGNGGSGARAYAEAVGVYLSFMISQVANHSSTVCGWNNTNAQMRSVFARQAIPMVWDFAESNLFCYSSGSYASLLGRQLKGFETLTERRRGFASQADVNGQCISSGKIISTDPPYFDNIGYADLSDFFYVWLRRTLQSVFPDLFTTMAVPKDEELIAAPYRHGGRDASERYFLDGMTSALSRLSEQGHPVFPLTVYYAFKQSEVIGGAGSRRTGWEAFLDAVISAGLSVTGTWPIRTEKRGRVIGNNANALASSIVLACRRRPSDARIATRREFQDALRREFPSALGDLQRGNIAPVELAQASIGPGMAVFSRYRQVLNADGSPMSVREALATINGTVGEVLAEQEGDLDPDTRWALAWFEQHGFSEGEFGRAETLIIAKNTSVGGLVRAGIVESGRGSVRLLKPSELDQDWNPSSDRRLTVWEMTHHLIRVLATGERKAASLAAKLGSAAEIALDLSYRLYTISERKNRAADALQYNSLVQSWPEIARLARQRPRPRQTVMLSQAEDGP